MSIENPLIGILVVSDRASRGEYEDMGGPAAEDWLRNVVTSATAYMRKIVSDGRDTVAAALREFAGAENANLILVCGGTGLAPQRRNARGPRRCY
ncbi:molybdopterin-binding protein [Shimia sediminis]|uniref:molybdopterin-binding protein n=1 Tax=Shimia sediminis TaxID=2497945 RepID=UPI001F2609E0|nr:molybdopterin-binding protein [Shimia sediminis]